MVINLITTPKWMVGEQFTVAEMVDEILVHSSTLDPRRTYMFIGWLHAHCSKVKSAMNVSEGLTAWLESMQYESIQWEYRLIMDEINWWRGLDERSLERMMLDHFVRSNL